MRKQKHPLAPAGEQLPVGVVLQDRSFRSSCAGVRKAAVHDVDRAVWRRFDRRHGGPDNALGQLTPVARRAIGLRQIVPRRARLLCRKRRSDEGREADGESVCSQCHRSNLTGCTNAPFPAESHAAKRTHFWFAASNGTSKRCRPNGASSVAETIRRPVVRPSPQTTSTNSSGKVHSTSAMMVRFAPLPWTLNDGINTSPEVAK